MAGETVVGQNLQPVSRAALLRNEQTTLAAKSNSDQTKYELAMIIRYLALRVCMLSVRQLIRASVRL